MRFAFIDAEKAHYPIRLLCQVLQVSRTGYYAWRSREPSERAQRDAVLGIKVRSIFGTHKKRYGSPRIHRELKAEGEAVSRKRVARLMAENDLQALSGRRFRVVTTDSDHEHQVAENLLDRQFDVARLNQAWAADLTYVWTAEGWLYLSVVLDLASRKVIGWSMADHMRAEIVTTALEMALGRRMPTDPLMHHSDRGSQYAGSECQALLDEHGVICSMSRRGNCWDNAVVESFFGTLKTELIYTRPWSTREAAHQAIAEYIELYYNTQRRHSHLGFISPVEFETKMEYRRLIAA